LDDGTVVEVRDHRTREIGRGLERKFNSEEMDWQVLLGLVDDLQSEVPDRVQRANDALATNAAMERHLHAGDYGLDERTGRRHGASIREKYAQTMRIVAAVKACGAMVQPAPSPSS
jgi:hypothetical protein